MGRYTVTALLGQGGMGAVYRARDTELDRDVALKVISGESNEPSRARFRREARAACAFSHPNAATVYDVGTEGGRPYLVMELVDGRPLRAYVGAADVTVEQKTTWLLEVARALAAAHRAGLVHRDVKPDNVLVAHSGEAKLVDFGIARGTDRVDPSGPTAAVDATQVTDTGAIVGSPAYMAPEQLRGLEIDGRADQFSWGVMAFELLLGKRPWEAATAFDLATAIVFGPAVDMRELASSAPALAPVLARCLARHTNERFASMDEVVAAVEGNAGEAAAPASPNREIVVPTRSSTAVTLSGAEAERPSRMRSSLFVALGGLAAGALALFALGGRGRTPPSLAAPSSAAGLGSDPPAAVSAPVPTMHACADQPDAGIDKCDVDNQAWCDRAGKRVACCLRGLVATPKGRCECPPNGTNEEAAISRGCKRAEPPSKEAIQAAVRAEFPNLDLCYQTAKKSNPKLEGKIVVGFHIEPDGTTSAIELRGANIPDAVLQDCIVDIFSRIRMPPAVGAYSDVTYPLNFTLDGEQVDK